MACWCARRSYDLISLPGLLNVLGLLVFLLCCFLLDCLYWKVGCIRRFLLGRIGCVLTRRGLRGRRICNGSLQMPWISLVLQDLQHVYDFLPRIFSNLTPPRVDPLPMVELIKDCPTEWSEILALYRTPFDDNELPSPSGGSSPNLVLPSAFSCSLCGDKSFAFGKALAQNNRIKTQS